MNRPRREGTAAETPRSSPPACHRRPGLQGTAAPWHCLPPACSPVSPCPPGRPAPAPSHHGTRLLDLELSGRHQQEPPYRISFGFHRAAISSLLSCGQKRGHESASSTANQAGGAAAPALLPGWGAPKSKPCPRPVPQARSLPSTPRRHERPSGIFGCTPRSQQGPCSWCTPPHQAQHWVQQHGLTSPPGAPVSAPAPGLLARPPCPAWQTNSPSATAHGCT